MAEDPEKLPGIEAHGTVRDVAGIVKHYGVPGRWAAAVRALEGVLSRARTRDLIWLEANARSELGSYRYYGSPWQGLDPSDVAGLPGAVQRLATFHANGRVRESAVRALASSHEPDVLPYMLLRANDWVGQVSARASAALEARLRPEDASAWISALPFESHVRALTRRGLAYLFDEARGLVIAPAARSALHHALQFDAVDVRRACSALVLSLPPSEQSPLLGVAIRDADPVVASSAAAALLGRGAEGELHETVGSLLVHRAAKVRMLALTALWAHFPAEAFDRSRVLLFDAARCVRELAQFELRRHRAIDLAAIYVDALPKARGRELLTAIAGLSECGDAKHAPLAAELIDHPSARVGGAALRALSRLDGDAYAPAFLDALRSASPRVVRVAREALKKRAHLVDRAQLDALLCAGGAPARAVLALLPQIDYWGALLASVRAAEDPDMRSVAHRVIDRLVGRQVYSLPPDHPSLERAFESVRDVLPMAKRVEDLLKLTRPLA